jgi:hypothetical protein
VSSVPDYASVSSTNGRGGVGPSFTVGMRNSPVQVFRSCEVAGSVVRHVEAENNCWSIPSSRKVRITGRPIRRPWRSETTHSRLRQTSEIGLRPRSGGGDR